MALAYIGLGANMENRTGNIAKAIYELSLQEDVEIVRKSRIEETDPVDYLEQPEFLNQIALIRTELNPSDLLQVLQDIENRIGRIRTTAKGPRIIDLDILLYDDIILELDDLEIPHPEIKNRDFILKHLVEIEPGLKDPLSGETYMNIYRRG